MIPVLRRRRRDDKPHLHVTAEPVRPREKFFAIVGITSPCSANSEGRFSEDRRRVRAADDEA